MASGKPATLVGGSGLSACLSVKVFSTHLCLSCGLPTSVSHWEQNLSQSWLLSEYLLNEWFKEWVTKKKRKNNSSESCMTPDLYAFYNHQVTLPFSCLPWAGFHNPCKIYYLCDHGPHALLPSWMIEESPLSSWFSECLLTCYLNQPLIINRSRPVRWNSFVSPAGKHYFRWIGQNQI